MLPCIYICIFVDFYKFMCISHNNNHDNNNNNNNNKKLGSKMSKIAKILTIIVAFDARFATW